MEPEGVLRHQSWGSDGSEDVSGDLLGCDAVWKYGWLPSFWKKKHTASIFSVELTNTHKITSQKSTIKTFITMFTEEGHCFLSSDGYTQFTSS